MVATIRFETELGSLSIKHIDAILGISIEFAFESFADGKLFALTINRPALIAHHQLFALDIGLAVDLTSERPKLIEPLAGGTMIGLTYVINIKDRPQEVVFHLLEESYPAGTDMRVIALERQTRILTREIGRLRKEIADIVTEQDCRDGEDTDRSIARVPFDKLIVSNEIAHAFMMEPDSYLHAKYKAHFESKMSPVGRAVSAFLDDGPDRLLFNMHYMNQRNGIEFIAPAKVAWETIPTGLVYRRTGWTANGFTFEVSKTRERKRYSFRPMGLEVFMPGAAGWPKHMRVISFKAATMNGFVNVMRDHLGQRIEGMHDLRFYKSPTACACVIITETDA